MGKGKNPHFVKLKLTLVVVEARIPACRQAGRLVYGSWIFELLTSSFLPRYQRRHL